MLRGLIPASLNACSYLGGFYQKGRFDIAAKGIFSQVSVCMVNFCRGRVLCGAFAAAHPRHAIRQSSGLRHERDRDEYEPTIQRRVWS